MKKITTNTQDTIEASYCIIDGESTSGEPFRRIYVTTDPREMRDFNAFMDTEKTTPTRDELDEHIAKKFPNMVLHSHNTGNDIQPLDELSFPESLPVGEGIWDEENNVQLLKRALMEHFKEWFDSARRRNNEIASSIPSYLGSGFIADNTRFLTASACSVFVVGAIEWRRYREQEKLQETLKIWIEFKENDKRNPIQALQTLNKRIKDSGLLFAGIPDGHNLKKFSNDFFDLLADKFKLHYNKDYLSNKLPKVRLPNKEDLLDASIWIHAKAVPNALHILSEQATDLVKNPFDKKTFKYVGRGLRYIGPLLWRHIAVHASKNASKNIQEFWHLNPENGALKTHDADSIPNIRIEKSQVIMKSVDPVIAARFVETLKHAHRERVDGVWMGSAFVGETVFMMAHGMEFHHAATKLYEDLQHDANIAPTPDMSMDDPLVALLISAYSLSLAFGAHGHLGREVARIYNTLGSKASELSQDSAHITEEYMKQRNSAPTAPNADPS